MLYPAITAQFQNNTPNNTHNFHRLNFLERNNNNSNKIKGFNNYNNNSSSNSSSSVSNYAVSSGNSFSQSNRSNSQDSFSGVENSDYVMTAGGANISVVTANNAATLPYNAGQDFFPVKKNLNEQNISGRGFIAKYCKNGVNCAQIKASVFFFTEIC